MKKTKRCGLIFLLIAAMVLCACGSESSGRTSSKKNYDEGMYRSESTTSVNSTFEPKTGYDFAVNETFTDDYYADNKNFNGANKDDFALNDTARKLIKTFSLTIETEDYDNFIVDIENQISTNFRGYVESMSASNNGVNNKSHNRYATITARIPAGSVEAFINLVGNCSFITNKTINVDDITLDYVDTESRLSTYEIEMEHLLAMLEKCETVEEMLEIESRMAEVRYDIENYGSRLRTYDNLVDYATVYMYINEVKTYTEPEVEPETYWDRVSESFSDSIENIWEGIKDFGVGFVGAVPGLLIFAVIAFILFLIGRKIYRKHFKKNKVEVTKPENPEENK